MITKRNGNGQTECYGCKEKGKFALTWDSWLYNFNDKPYCFDCLMEKLEELDKENQKYKEVIDNIKYYLEENGNQMSEDAIYDLMNFIKEV